jgi:hypothetical protein
MDQLLGFLGQHVPVGPDGSGRRCAFSWHRTRYTQPPASSVREHLLKLGTQVVVSYVIRLTDTLMPRGSNAFIG